MVCVLHILHCVILIQLIVILGSEDTVIILLMPFQASLVQVKAVWLQQHDLLHL